MKLEVELSSSCCHPSDGLGPNTFERTHLQWSSGTQHLQHVDRLLTAHGEPHADKAVSGAQEALDRLAADRELLLQLSLRGYQGPEWENFRTVLAKYGCAVLRGWCLNGKIFAHCAAVGYGRPLPPPREIRTDDAEELAGETVARALNYFRDEVLVACRWDAAKGASLRTFFVGGCIRSFSNVYSTWRKENQDTYATAAELETVPARWAPPEARIKLASTLASIPGDARDLISLAALGHSHREIAETLGLTPKSVERRIARVRRHLKERHDLRVA